MDIVNAYLPCIWHSTDRLVFDFLSGNENYRASENRLPSIITLPRVNQRNKDDPAVDLAHVERLLDHEVRSWHSAGANYNEIGLPLTPLVDQEEWELLPALLPEWFGDL